MISLMEGCSSISQWSNIYEQQGGIDTPRSISLFMDPIQEIHRNDHGISTISHSILPQGRGVISWGEGAPSDMCTTLPMMTPLVGGNNMIQSQPFDASKSGTTSSIDQSLECLLSGAISNTDTSDEDDGISLLFSSDFSKNIFNFSSNNNNINPRKRGHNMHIFQENHQKIKLITTSSTSGPKGNKRQKYNNTNNSTDTERSEVRLSNLSNISFQQGSKSGSALINAEPDAEAIQQMKEMIYRAAAFRPINFGVEEVELRPKRKNVRISNDPQTVAARQRRERISERLKVLQKLVPGGTKMDTASMLDEAANYLKFLRNQVKELENLGNYKLDQYHNYSTSSNHSSNHQFLPPPSVNVEFSPMIFPMQASQYSPSNPYHAHVLKS